MTRTQERYAAIHELLAAGESLHAISRSLSLSRPTVRRFAHAASPADLLAESLRESKLDWFKPYICQRWNEGLTDVTALHAELQERGFTGSVRTLRRYVAPFRQDTAAPPTSRSRSRWHPRRWSSMTCTRWRARAGGCTGQRRRLAPGRRGRSATG